MGKTILAFVIIAMCVWGVFQIIPQIPKELMFTYIKKIFWGLLAVVVAYWILFMFVQLF